jgi:lysophospholipase L1-like esterase
MNQGNQAIKDIAQKYGAAYLDLSNCGLDRNLSLYTSDGLHPTAKGMELIADEMIRRLRAEKRNGSLIGEKH